MTRTRTALGLGVAGLLLLAACGDGDSGGNDGDGGSAGAATIAIESFQFKPEKLTVEVGTEVTWTNRDDAAHTVKAKTDGTAAFDSDELGQDETFAHTFEAAGEIEYFCEIHQYMTATVVVEG